MAPDPSEVSTCGLRNCGDMKWVSLLRGNDLLLTKIGTPKRADALCAPGLGSDPIEGIGPIGHVSLIDTELPLRLELSPNVLHGDSVAVRRKIVSRVRTPGLVVWRTHEDCRKRTRDVAGTIDVGRQLYAIAHRH